MTPVSHARFGDDSRKLPPAKTGPNQFPGAFKVARADALLRTTGQYGKWEALCQKDDGFAVKMADLVLERHDLVEKAGRGEAVPRQTFDALTEKLAKNGIRLHKSVDLARTLPAFAGSGPETGPVPSSEEDIPSRLPAAKTDEGHVAQASWESDPLSGAVPQGVKAGNDKASAVASQSPEPVIESPFARRSGNGSVQGASAQPVQPAHPVSAAVADQSNGRSAYTAGAAASPSPVKRAGGVLAPETASVSMDVENLVILNAQYKNILLNEGLIGYGDGKRVFIPLGETARTIDFDIRVDDGAGTAKGWFISEDRSFDLDLSKMKVTAGGREMTIPEGGAVAKDGDIYVDARLLSEWFPVDFRYDSLEQSLRVEPREKLPLQARMDRENSRGGIGRASGGESTLPRVTTGYSVMEPPVVDFDLRSTYENGKERDNGFELDYAVLARGDLGKMTAEMFLSGDSDEGLENSRVTLERGDPDGNLLGPLGATHVSVGDVRVPEFPILSGGQNETGVAIGNRDLNRTRDFDTTYFEGDLPPGWDVEVYRNGNLQDSHRVGSDGRYAFEEVPLYYGKNDFELVFYGPQGQKRVETKRIDVGSEMLRKGEGEYLLSATAKDAILIDPDPDFRTRDEDTLRVVGRYEYGVSERLSVGVGFQSQEVNEERHEYLNAGVKGNLGGIFVGGDYVHDSRGGDAVETFIQTGVGPVDLKLRQEIYSSFSEGNTSEADPLKSRTNLSLSGRMEGRGALPEIPYSFSYTRTQREDSTEDRLSTSLSAGLGQVYFNNHLDWIDDSRHDSTLVEGQFRAVGQLGDFRLRGTMYYELEPAGEVENVEFSTLYNPGGNLSSEFLLGADFENEDKVAGALRLNWDSGNYLLSPQVSYNSEGEFTATVALTTSLGARPRSGNPYLTSAKGADSGAVSARVFHDVNNNAVFDAGDEPVEGARVRAVQAYKHAETDENGVALLTGLGKYKPTDVVVDRGSLEDPFWEPAAGGVSVVPRPGHAELLEIPVITTGEIDGTVFLATENDTEKPMSNVRLQLLDETGEIAGEGRSEYDGFYLFMKVAPGNYTVRLHPESAERLGVAPASQAGIEIATDGTVVSGKDLLLRAPLAGPAVAAREPIAPSAGPAIATAEMSGPASEGAAWTPEEFEVPVAPSVAVSEPSESSAEVAAAHRQAVEPAVMEKEVLPKGTDDAVAAGGISEEEQNYILRNYLEDMAHGARKGGAAGGSIPAVVAAGAAAGVSPAAGVEPGAEKAPVASAGQRYGVHLTSYRTPEKAVAGIAELKNRYAKVLGNTDYTVQKVDLGPEKGEWYRVVAGAFGGREGAVALEGKIRMAAPYTRVVPLENGSARGIHMTSFRTMAKARLSIQELKTRYPDLLENEPFSIRTVDLGPEKGVWKRVIAGSFSNDTEALALAEKIKLVSPYTKVMAIEKESEFGVHLSSYREHDKAARGLALLQKKIGPMLGDESVYIRRVDLGPQKGVWYRVMAGRFEDREAAAPLSRALDEAGQYANVMGL